MPEESPIGAIFRKKLDSLPKDTCLDIMLKPRICYEAGDSKFGYGLENYKRLKGAEDKAINSLVHYLKNSEIEHSKPKVPGFIIATMKVSDIYLLEEKSLARVIMEP